jgi:hypothetical protein
MLSRRNQTNKCMYCKIPFIWNCRRCTLIFGGHLERAGKDGREGLQKNMRRLLG